MELLPISDSGVTDGGLSQDAGICTFVFLKTVELLNKKVFCECQVFQGRGLSFLTELQVPLWRVLSLETAAPKSRNHLC